MHSTSYRTPSLFSFFICCTFIFSTLYTQQSPGGEGLSIPYNNWVWIAAIVVICTGCFQIITSQQIRLPQHWLGIAALPIGLIISGFIVGTSNPTQWLFRIGYVLGGFLFFLSLFQIKLNRRQLENIFYILCFVASIHSLIAFTQVQGWKFTSLIPYTLGNKPISIFQQVNIHATYLISSFFIALYLASSPSAQRRSNWLKLVLIFCIFSTTTLLLVIGSRTTLVVFCISLPLLLTARYTAFKKHSSIALLLLAAFIAGVTAGAVFSKGFERYETKLQRQTGNSRPYIYELSWQVFQEKPLLGHGLGSFEKVFQEAKTTYPNSDKLNKQRFSHPHNELLFWMIESGLSSLIGISIALLATLRALWKTGWRRACSYLALLFPISFHTQVELPFYLSSALWFLWLTLLYCCHSHNIKTYQTKLSKAGSKFIFCSTLTISSMMIGFFIHSIISVFGIVEFMRNTKLDYKHLQAASNNLYFQDLNQQLLSTSLLYHSIAAGDKSYLPEYIRWANSYLKISPATNIYRDLALAYAYLDQYDKALAVTQRAVKIYPVTEDLVQRHQEITAKLPISEFKQKIVIGVLHNQVPATGVKSHTSSRALQIQEND